MSKAHGQISLKELFFAFTKIGATAFGGGFAILPFLERELIEKRHWIATKELLDFYAVAQVMPGIIAVNISAIIGYQKRAVAGAICAALGMMMPSLIIITAIAAFLGLWTEAEIVMRIFAAVQIAVAALVINAVIPFFKRGIINRFTFLLFVLSFLAFYFLKISPALVVVLCALAYMAYDFAKGGFE